MKGGKRRRDKTTPPKTPHHISYYTIPYHHAIKYHRIGPSSFVYLLTEEGVYTRTAFDRTAFDRRRHII